MSANLTCKGIFTELEKIQAMVVASRHAIAAISDHDADMVCILLREADNRIFALKSQLEDDEADVPRTTN